MINEYCFVIWTNGVSCIFVVEPEQDYLTCGDCQRDFLLSDILKFIQHKINRCNKENVDPFDENYFEDEEEQQESMSSVITSHRTSISAPITQRKGTPELRSDKTSPRPSLSLSQSSVTAPADADSTIDGSDIKPDPETLASGARLNTPDVKRIDTASNTTLSGISTRMFQFIIISKIDLIFKKRFNVLKI